MGNDKLDTMEIPYTASTIGVIRSNLAGLKGFDTMALELIQNADDAGASKIVFNVTPEGLWVSNNSSFTSCGNLNIGFCPLLETDAKRPCDFHAIAEIGKGSKLLDSENIGRFGVGFTSTYQVTDSPQIYSSGICMTLNPYEGACKSKLISPTAGTRFFLPWAADPSSATRKALDLSPFEPAQIEQLIKDIHSALSIGLLFLKKVRHAELQQDGEPIITCNIKESAPSRIKLKFSPGTDEIWYIMRTDVHEQAQILYRKYPRLQYRLDKTIVEIAIRTHPQPLTDGFLYAFLPTQQTSGLPLHINADFYPVTNRKSLVFSGGQHDQIWNDMLISEAATLLASNLEDLYKIVGPSQLWDIIKKALDLANWKRSPSCFNKFAENIRQQGKDAHIALAYDGSARLPKKLYFSPTDCEEAEFSALSQLGIAVVAPQLRQYYNAMSMLGTRPLTLEHLLPSASRVLEERFKQNTSVSEIDYSNLYVPLWRVIDKLIPNEFSKEPGSKKAPTSVVELQDLPLIITANYQICKMADAIKSNHIYKPSELVELIPTLPVAHHSIYEYTNLAGRIDTLDFKWLVSFLYKSLRDNQYPEQIIPTDKLKLMKLYDLLTNLDSQAELDSKIEENDYYTALSKCQIWKTRQGNFVTLDEAVLPGDFQDPTNLSHLLDVDFLSTEAQLFLQNKLGVKKQTYEEFVRFTVPKLFNDDGPLASEQYLIIIEDMANYPALIEQQEIVDILANLPLAPTCDGGWANINQVYIRTDELIRVLGDNPSLWLDLSRVPEKKSIITFYRNIGLLEKPSLKHLYERMEQIALYISPTPEAKQMSAEAFYAICEQYEFQKDEKEFRNVLHELKNTACFPADGDDQLWYLAEKLYVPYRAEIIESQVKILNFKNPQRLSSELLYELGMNKPCTDLVIKHLRYCIKNNVAPRVDVYRFLNDVANNNEAFGEHNLIQQLTEQPCIYVSKSKCFVLPERIYQTLPDLGGYAFKIPEELESFRPLLRLLGIQDSPALSNYVDILLEITVDHDSRSEPLSPEKYSVYKTCLAQINDAYHSDNLADDELERLQNFASILNLLGTPKMPDELLINDSERYAAYFGLELNHALCHPRPEFFALYEALGIRRLSRVSKILLQNVIGQELIEEEIQATLAERAGILARLLNNKVSEERNLVLQTITRLKVSSFEKIKIKVSINMGDNNMFESTTQAADAYFDISQCVIYIQRPLDSRSWSHIYREIFNQLMPDETSDRLQSLVLNMCLTMRLSLDEAHQMLTDADCPSSTVENLIDEVPTHESKISKIAEPDESETNFESTQNPILNQNVDIEPVDTSRPSNTEPPQNRPDSPDITQTPVPREKQFGIVGHDNEKPQAPDIIPSDGIYKQPTVTTPNQNRLPDKRPRHKVQRDYRLRSYVSQDQLESTDQDTDSARSEQQLAIEATARQVVCQYEKRHGRLAEQMAQTQPGYDIKSSDSHTGETRLIEVKGISGVWNSFGIGLSDRQFNCAREHGDIYWLYVVENISSPGNERVYPIQDPARKVNSFFYDDGWKNIAVSEDADLKSRFIPGAVVEHVSHGRGIIKSRSLRGETVMLEIEFDQFADQAQKMPLNMAQLKVVEVTHG